MNKLHNFLIKQNEKKKRNFPDRRGSNNPNWKGGTRRLGSYYWVYSPGHPSAVRYGQTPYVMRARLNLEKKVGRVLRKSELPHHRNLNKLDDHPRNLELKTRQEHNRLHFVGLSNAERRKIAQVASARFDMHKKRTQPVVIRKRTPKR